MFTGTGLEPVVFALWGQQSEFDVRRPAAALNPFLLRLGESLAASMAAAGGKWASVV
jgi:hypothetical protein